jgi:hypothetical protein
MNTVPFSIDILAGFGKCEGMLKDAGGGTITIEFQNSDKFGGLIKSDIKLVAVPLKDLTSVTISRGWLGTTWLGVKLCLQGKDLATLKDVPGMSMGRVELSVARKDIAAAEKFVDGLHEANG